MTDLHAETREGKRQDFFREVFEQLAPKILTIREEKCLWRYLGFEGDMTLEEIANMYGVTRERVRQIVIKGMRRFVGRSVGGVNLKNAVTGSSQYDGPLLGIHDFCLSVRSGNVMRRAGVDTLGDLLFLGRTRLMAKRNFGKDGIREVDAIITRLGLGKVWFDKENA